MTLQPFFDDVFTVARSWMIVFNFFVGSKMGRSFWPFVGFEFVGKFLVEESFEVVGFAEVKILRQVVGVDLIHEKAK